MVCKTMPNAFPIVVAGFDSDEDAVAYAKLSALSDKGRSYVVFSIVDIACK